MVLLLFPDLEEELEVLLYKMVGKVVRMILLLLANHFVCLCVEIPACTCKVVQLPTWRNFLLHLAAPISIVLVA
jgi:hypothetical protein